MLEKVRKQIEGESVPTALGLAGARRSARVRTSCCASRRCLVSSGGDHDQAIPPHGSFRSGGGASATPAASQLEAETRCALPILRGEPRLRKGGRFHQHAV